MSNLRQGTSPFEATVNWWRGLCTAVITLAAFVIVLAEPRCLLYWRDGAYELNAEGTGLPGTLTSVLFLLYLLIDSTIGCVCRQRFRRSMLSVHCHHAVVGVAVAGFLLPSPPRGFFLYVWGEALTAVRLLPPRQRFHARTCVFAGRRCLWLYLLIRDYSFYSATAARFGGVAAVVPMAVALLLLALDYNWWREHARSGAGGAGGSSSKWRGNDHASPAAGDDARGLDMGASSPSEDENGHLCGGEMEGITITIGGGDGAVEQRPVSSSTSSQSVPHVSKVASTELCLGALAPPPVI